MEQSYDSQMDIGQNAKTLCVVRVLYVFTIHFDGNGGRKTHPEVRFSVAIRTTVFFATNLTEHANHLRYHAFCAGYVVKQ